MVLTPSPLAAGSAGLAATAAPAATRCLSLSAERFQTVIVCPTSMSRWAMAAPILPIPAMPICIGLASYALAPHCHVVGSRRDDKGLGPPEIGLRWPMRRSRLEAGEIAV